MPKIGVKTSAERPCGGVFYAGKTGRYLLCRFKPGGGLGAGRNQTGTYSSERRGKQVQSHRYCRGHNKPKPKTALPTHIKINSAKTGLQKDSIVLLEQVRTLDKKRLKSRMGALDSFSMNLIDKALSVSFGL